MNGEWRIFRWETQLSLFYEFAFQSHASKSRYFTVDIMIRIDQSNAGNFRANFDAFGSPFYG